MPKDSGENCTSNEVESKCFCTSWERRLETRGWNKCFDGIQLELVLIDRKGKNSKAKMAQNNHYIRKERCGSKLNNR